jgi:hypothetical protein
MRLDVPMSVPDPASWRKVARQVVPQGARRRLRRAALAREYAGDAVDCPCCEHSFREFAPDGRANPNRICPSCDAHQRHRLLAYWLNEELPSWSTGPIDVLHFAPEPIMEPRLRGIAREYLSTDLDAPQAMLHADIQSLPLSDDAFDLVVCSHVLEHVPDDRQAMRELARVLKPGGRALILVPMDVARPDTYEDPAITEPEDRVRAFWQADHMRLYGRDAPNRMRDAGLIVVVDRYAESLPHDVIARHAMGSPGMFVCTVD